MIFEFCAGYRIPSNFPACTPRATHWYKGEVEAATQHDAEIAAIVKTYADLKNNCEHVIPRVWEKKNDATI